MNALSYALAGKSPKPKSTESPAPSVKAILLALVVVLAGCAGSPGKAPSTSSGEDEVRLTCALVDQTGKPLAPGTCRFRFGGLDITQDVNAEGKTVAMVARGAAGEVVGAAPNRSAVAVELVADSDKLIRLSLIASDPGSPSTTSTSTSVPVTTTPSEGPPVVHVAARVWRDPVTVVSSGSGAEPHLAMAPDGTIYYAPVNQLYRSTDGGLSFQDVSPGIVEALPVLGGDTAVQVAPDGSVWYSRYWGYAGGTIGCTSTTRGDTWTCDNAAIPGVTDRMWIAGKDATTGFVQTNEGLYHHIWAKTLTGSLKYAPHATSTALLAVRNGNMVYDATRDAFFQIEWTGASQKLLRVDTALAFVTSRDTRVPNSYALPWLSVHDGVLWTTGEVAGADGSRSVLAARSLDGGDSWEQFPIESNALSVTFSYIAAGPNGRTALIYYGSDQPGPSTNNGGTWSLYVAETDNGLAPNPVWVERVLVPEVHVGNVCIGLNCETSGGDPRARFAGDLIGAWVDGDGNVHAAYVADTGGTARGMYVRQHMV